MIRPLDPHPLVTKNILSNGFKPIHSNAKRELIFHEVEITIPNLDVQPDRSSNRGTKLNRRPEDVVGALLSNMFGSNSAQAFSEFLNKTVKSQEVLLADHDQRMVNLIRARDPHRSIIDEPKNNLKGDKRNWIKSSVLTFTPISQSTSRRKI